MPRLQGSSAVTIPQLLLPISFLLLDHRTNYYHRRIDLPDRIQCSRCRVRKPSGMYSGNQLADYTEQLSINPNIRNRAQLYITCQACTGGGALEHECVDCQKVLPISRFSKTMLRNNRDNAMCMKCHQAQMDISPIASDAEDDDNADGNFAPPDCDDDGDEDASHGGTIFETSTLNGSGGLSLPPSESGYGDGVSVSSHGGGVSLIGDNNRYNNASASFRAMSISSNPSSSSKAIARLKASTKTDTKWPKPPSQSDPKHLDMAKHYTVKQSLHDVQVYRTPSPEGRMGPTEEDTSDWDDEDDDDDDDSD